MKLIDLQSVVLAAWIGRLWQHTVILQIGLEGCSFCETVLTHRDRASPFHFHDLLASQEKDFFKLLAPFLTSDSDQEIRVINDKNCLLNTKINEDYVVVVCFYPLACITIKCKWNGHGQQVHFTKWKQLDHVFTLHSFLSENQNVLE
jgi:hypothetical protein